MTSSDPDRTFGNRVRVLLVEDNDVDAEVVQREIASTGNADLRRCVRLRDALAWLRTEPVDCIVLDLDLPDSTGLATLQMVVASNRNVPVVVLTGHDDVGVGIDALDRGAHEYLVKGELHGGALRRHIRYAMARRGHDAERESDWQRIHAANSHLESVTARLAAMNDRLRGERRRLRRTIDRDELTGAFTRAAFEHQLDRLTSAPDHERPWGLIFCDIDKFKAINDTYGHMVGDLVLATVARRIADSVRPGDVVARVGGDEFIVLCPGLETGDDPRSLVARVDEAVCRPMVVGVRWLSVRVSAGIAVSGPGEPAKDVIRRADRAMYEAKRSARSRHRW